MPRGDKQSNRDAQEMPSSSQTKYDDVLRWQGQVPSSSSSNDISPQQRQEIRQAVAKNWTKLSEDNRKAYGNKENWQKAIERQLLGFSPEDREEEFQKIRELNQ